MPLPIAYPHPELTLFPRRPVIDITPAGGTRHILLARKITAKPQREYVDYNQTDANGITRLARRITSKWADEFIVELDEYHSELAVMLDGETLASQIITPHLCSLYGIDLTGGNFGTPAMRVVGQDDYLRFRCVLAAEGERSFEGDSASKMSLKITATEPIYYLYDLDFFRGNTGNPAGTATVTATLTGGGTFSFDQVSNAVISSGTSGSPAGLLGGGNSFEDAIRLLTRQSDITGLVFAKTGAATVTSILVYGLPNLSAVTVSNMGLTAIQLDALYRSLPDRTGLVAGTIAVTGNPGTGTDTPALATAKNWTVTGS